MNKLGTFLEDNAGGFSSTRLAFLLWTIGVLVVWISSSWGGELAKIDSSITTILGILMSGKVVQRFGENQPAPVQPPNSKPATSGGNAVISVNVGRAEAE